jgi:hypothetical protein
MDTNETSKVQMVVQANDIAYSVVRVEATGRVGQEHSVNTNDLAHPGGKGDGLHIMALVEAEKKMNERWFFLEGLRRSVATDCALPTRSMTGTFSLPSVPKISLPAWPATITIHFSAF